MILEQEDNVKKRNIVFGLLFAISLFLIGGFSLDRFGFHSDLIGIVGTLLLIVAYLGLNWAKLKSGDHRIRVATTWIIGLLIIVIILNIIEAALA